MKGLALAFLFMASMLWLRGYQKPPQTITIERDIKGPLFWKPEQDTIRSKKYLFPTRRPWDSHKPKQIR